jgi:hypothetical protein
MNDYIYRGDKLTDEKYKLRHCVAVRRRDGKCIRGKNGNMLVSIGGKNVIVPARQLRKTGNKIL